MYGVCAENTCVYAHMTCTMYVCVYLYVLYEWEGQLDDESRVIGEGMREKEEGERERDGWRKREGEREREREKGGGVGC